MNDNITLTIDEIHAICKEHSTRTQNLPYDEYRILLEEEAAPVRLALERAKALQKKQTVFNSKDSTKKYINLNNVI